MKRYWIFILLCAIIAFPLRGVAQNNLSAKFSPSTVQFLDERDGSAQLPKANERRKLAIASPDIKISADKEADIYLRRQIAEVANINGTKLVSAFVSVSDGNFAPLKSLGVEIQSEFKNLATVAIPIDQIEAVAALSNVTNIEVAEVLEPLTDRSRTETRAFDAINNTAVAQALGITKAYTGKGVILGVIDTGIDFQHIAFKDKDGNSRIVRAYTLANTSGSLTTHSTASAIAALTYDTDSGSHGTHTCSTAGGSSVIIDGDNVTVTDDHTNATYGGMAPEADLVLCGLSSLYTTAIGNAIKAICDYADQVGKPCVISLSLGSQSGPHDGSGSIASIVSQYAGDNHIIVYAASNDAQRADAFVEYGTSAGGGMYASATATSAKPFLANVQRSFTDATGNLQLPYPTIYAYARTPNVPLTLKFTVVNVSTGAVLYTSSAYSLSSSSTTNTTLSITGSTGLGKYFYSTTSYSNQYSTSDTGRIRIIGGRDSYSNKYYFAIYCPMMISRSYSQDENTSLYNSNYAFCVSIYPTSTSSSTIVDAWESTYCWFGTDLNLASGASYNLATGSDACSVSDNACYDDIISVGAYISKNQVTTYKGETLDLSSSFGEIGNHAYFSSWQGDGYGPTGKPLPTINAPGATITAAVNHYSSDYMDDENYDYGNARVNTNTTYPYGNMEGTSMATPCVSGIIALWLQAAKDAGKTANPDYIKEVLEATAIHDDFTSGARGDGAETFGTHGKIDALAGLQYILGTTGGPTLSATPESLSFEGYTGLHYEQTLSVKGVTLEDGVTATLNDPAGIYSIDKTSLTQAEAESEATIAVSYDPTEAGNTTATLTFSSLNADDVVVNLSGTAELATPTLEVSPDALTFSTNLSEESSKTFTVTGRFLESDVNVALTDANGVFEVSSNRLRQDEVEDGGVEVTVKFVADAEGTYSGSVRLTSSGAEAVVVNLSAEATDGGKASDNYLSLNKYASIDDTEWTATTVDKFYIYTEYPDDEVAWLTMTSYVSALNITNNTQGWIERNGSTIRDGSWSAEDIFLGSSAYFTSSQTPKVKGTASTTGTTAQESSYYVTDCTGVKVLGHNNTGASSTYPAYIRVYECTRNADGTLAVDLTPISRNNARKVLTVGTTVVASAQNTTANTDFSLSVSGLDKEKIYKVTVGAARGYFKEIGLQLPITPITGIETISADEAAGSDIWFTLRGQRLNGIPAQQGLYIHNGKVVLVSKL